MKFRPCIDIHNGKVKQIVGGSLRDLGDFAEENFVSEKNAAWYASFYKSLNLTGGHVILLNGKDSPYYEDTKKEALEALSAFPGGLMAGGGINTENAEIFLDAGASHVIVTSFVFKDGRIEYDRLKELSALCGPERLCLDLSCRKKRTDDGEKYYIVTDRWQKFTDTVLSEELMAELSTYCSEFLIHAVDAEGKAKGIEKKVAEIISAEGLPPVTYAGGVGSYKDIEILRECGKGRVDVTIGSALDLFGGKLELKKVLTMV